MTKNNNQITTGKFNSNADEIRHYTLELLASGKRYARQYIKSYVTKESGRQFTDGTFSGALRDLVQDNANVISPERGYYQLIKQEIYSEDDFEEVTIKNLENFIDEINKLAKSVNPLRITDDQQRIFNVLNDTIYNLNSSISKIKVESTTNAQKK